MACKKMKCYNIWFLFVLYNSVGLCASRYTTQEFSTIIDTTVSRRETLAFVKRHLKHQHCTRTMNADVKFFHRKAQHRPLYESSVQDMDSLDRRKELYNNIWEWGRNIKGSFLHPSIEPIVRHPSDGGAGIVAVEPIPANTVVMSIPMENSINIQGTLLSLLNEEERIDNSEKRLSKELKKIAAASEGGQMAALVGIFAHLHLMRLKQSRKEITKLLSSKTEPSLAERKDDEQLIIEKLGPFLDTLPMLPQLPDGNFQQQKEPRQHPFPSHVLFWTDDEIEILLNGTIAQTMARSVRAGSGAIVATISSAFLKEYCRDKESPSYILPQDVLDSIIASHALILSRSFGGATGENVEGFGRQVFPILDLLNHDGSKPTVRWGEDGGNAVVETIRNVDIGEELLKDYGWRPSWDFGISYGFVPDENVNDSGNEDGEGKENANEIYDAAGIPLFPPVLKLNNGSILDLTAEVNYSPLVKLVQQAATKMNLEDGIKNDCKVPEIVSLFRKPPFLGENNSQSMFPRRQPCLVLSKRREQDTTTKEAINDILAAFRAAASVLSIASLEGEAVKEVNDKIIEEVINLANDGGDQAALALVEQGINDRIKVLEFTGTIAESWGDIPGNPASAYGRALIARQMRQSELNTLRSVLKELTIVNI